MKQSKKEFILKTLLPYFTGEEERAFNNNNCLYLTADGRKCAIGKWMKEGEWQHYTGGVCGLVEKYKLEDILIEEALEQNLSLDEWREIQAVHDQLLTLDFQRLWVPLEKATGLMFPELRGAIKK